MSRELFCGIVAIVTIFVAILLAYARYKHEPVKAWLDTPISAKVFFYNLIGMVAALVVATIIAANLPSKLDEEKDWVKLCRSGDISPNTCKNNGVDFSYTVR